MSLRIFLCFVLIAVASHWGIAQQPALSFDVASIKPNKSGSGDASINGRPGGSFSAVNVTMMQLMRNAFGIQEYQVSGQPPWFNSERFDIEAKPSPEIAKQGDRLIWQPMLQALLADRFKLTYHKEKKDMPAYELVVSKSGHKLQKAEPGDCNPPLAGNCGFRASSNQIIGDRVSMEMFATRLSRSLGRTVVDKTTLSGVFNLTLKWTPDPTQFGLPPDASAPDGTGPTIFTAMQEQLGLRLEGIRVPVDAFVIDRVERPSEN